MSWSVILDSCVFYLGTSLEQAGIFEILLGCVLGEINPFNNSDGYFLAFHEEMVAQNTTIGQDTTRIIVDHIQTHSSCTQASNGTDKLTEYALFPIQKCRRLISSFVVFQLHWRCEVKLLGDLVQGLLEIISSRVSN